MYWYSVLVFSLLSANYGFGLRHGNNVCRTLGDYKTIHTNKNCSYNPDVGSTPRLIAKRHGYPFEQHTVTTKDGYILTLHRIPRPRNGTSLDGQRRQPILIQHGLATYSVIWMLQGKKSLAFYLADQGYDVWLTNSRGTYYSTKHISLPTNDPQFWNFGFHEIAIYDLPASIDFIANKTGEKGNLIYVGHSMGTTISYIYSILERKHAEENLKAIISLAPVAYMKNVMGTFRLLASSTPFLANLFKSAGLYALGQNQRLQRALLGATCGKYPLIIQCNLLLFFSSGLSVEQFRADLFPVFLSYYPAGVSIKTLQHFAQVITSGGNFRMYDYGPKKNMLLYNSTSPPPYDVTQITLPVYLFVGAQDVIAQPKDADTLETILKSRKPERIVEKYTFPFAHNDFFMAKDPQPFYKTLLQVIRTNT